MARYRPRPDGLYEAETSAGFLPMPLDGYQLSELGYEREAHDPDLRLASNAGGGGASGADPMTPTSVRSAVDAPGSMPPLQSELRRALTIEENTGQITPAEREERAAELDRIGAEQAAARAPSADRFEPDRETISLDDEGSGGEELPRYARTVAFDEKGSWQVRPGYAPAEELLEEEAGQAIDRKASMLDAGERAAQRAALVEREADRAIAQQERQAGEAEIRLAAMRREVGRRQSQIDAERAAVDKLEVDPERIFSGDAGGFAKVIAWIGVLAGGTLQGLHGMARNPGLDALNTTIDRDIRLQKEKIELRRQGVQAQETELERLMAIYGSPKIAEEELRERQLALVSAYAKRATMNSPEDVRANVEQALADYDAQRLARRFEIDQQAQAQVVENWRHVPAQTVQIGGPRPLTKEEKAERKDARVRQIKIDGATGYVASPEAAKDVQKQISGMTHLDRQLGVYEEEIKKADLGNRQARQRLEANFNNLVADLSTATEQGVTRSEDFVQAKAKLGSADEFFGSRESAINRLNATRQYYRRRRNQVIEDNVYSDPDATAPFKRAAPPDVRRE